MSSSTDNPISLWREILKSMNRIMKSNSLHFHLLSLIFLFPVFFTLVVYPSFHLYFFHPDFNFFDSSTQLSSLEIIVTLAYASLLVFFFLCAVATITYSAVQVSNDQPINLVSSIKSITNSFFPLLSTLIVSHAIFISVFLVFILVFYFVVQILLSLGLSYDLNHFWFLLILVPVLVWLQVNWSLAYVIAVVESRYGFETLRRSAYLLKGKRRRWVAFSMMLIYGLVMGMLVVPGSMYLVIVDAAKGNKWRSLGVILQTAECSLLGFMMMNQYLLGNVALYVYCKDFNGEKSPLEIGDKLPGEYLSMPLDDEKKNHGIVQVV